MAIKEKKLYPTPENAQRSNDDVIPIAWASAYIADLVKKVPEAERASIRLVGWTKIKLVWDHTQTPDEIMNEKLQNARALLDRLAGSNVGAKPEEILELKKILGL